MHEAATVVVDISVFEHAVQTLREEVQRIQRAILLGQKVRHCAHEEMQVTSVYYPGEDESSGCSDEGQFNPIKCEQLIYSLLVAYRCSSLRCMS